MGYIDDIVQKALDGEKRKEGRIKFWEMLHLIGGGLKKRKALSRKDENTLSVKYEKNQEHLLSQGMKSFNLHFILTTTLHDRIASYFIFMLPIGKTPEIQKDN